MFPFINPWTYYIINDEMPDMYNSPDPKWATKVILCIVYYIVISALWATGFVFVLDKFVGFGSENFMTWFTILVFPSLAVYVASIIAGFNAILDHGDKNRRKTRREKKGAKRQ